MSVGFVHPEDGIPFLEDLLVQVPETPVYDPDNYYAPPGEKELVYRHGDSYPGGEEDRCGRGKVDHLAPLGVLHYRPRSDETDPQGYGLYNTDGIAADKVCPASNLSEIDDYHTPEKGEESRSTPDKHVSPHSGWFSDHFPLEPDYSPQDHCESDLGKRENLFLKTHDETPFRIREPYGYMISQRRPSGPVGLTFLIIPVLVLVLLLLPFSCRALAVPQNAFRFVDESFDKPLVPVSRITTLQQEFRERFFSPWNREIPSISRENALWAFDAWKERLPWGENLRPRSREFLESLKVNCAMNDWGSLSRKAIACGDSDLRALPTDRPFFRDPSLAGEGFPFDYLQNSRVKAGEPLFASHFSADGRWIFVEAGYAAGWVDSRDVAFVDEETVGKWRGMPLGFVLKDDLPVKNRSGAYLFSARTGTVLPIVSAGVSGGPVRVGVPTRGRDGKALLEEALLPGGAVSKGPLEFTRWNVALVINEMLGTPYGWGDSMGNRDCSGTMRDLFAVFGVWLPRNSAAQAKAYPFVSLEGLAVKEKREKLLLEGNPFVTLLRVPGHIMLYLGEYRGEPCVFHSFWGVRTTSSGAEGRHVFGAAVITTLYPGKGVEDFDTSRGDLLERLAGMTFLTLGP